MCTLNLGDITTRLHADQDRMNQPASIPLVTPGIPWTWVTLLAAKYWSQVALRKGESQNIRHSWVVTVPLAVSMVLAHTSKVFHTKVRFPKTQTLHRGKAQTACQGTGCVFGSTQLVLTYLVKIHNMKLWNVTLSPMVQLDSIQFSWIDLVTYSTTALQIWTEKSKLI